MSSGLKSVSFSRAFRAASSPEIHRYACAHRHDGSQISEFARDGKINDELGGHLQGHRCMEEVPLTLGLSCCLLPS